jgi:hypothetical protein
MSFVLHLLWSAGCLAGRKIFNIMSNEELILYEIRQIKNDMHRMENVLEKIADTQKDGWKEGRPVIIHQYYLTDPKNVKEYKLIQNESTELVLCQQQQPQKNLIQNIGRDFAVSQPKKEETTPDPVYPTTQEEEITDES